jgi:hypothetical protein
LCLHPQQQRDILAETIAACKPRGIRVVPYVSTGHKLAWTMVTRDYPEYAQRTKPGGGPARSHMFVGEDHGTVCWNTPYRQAYSTWWTSGRDDRRHLRPLGLRPVGTGCLLLRRLLQRSQSEAWVALRKRATTAPNYAIDHIGGFEHAG